MDSTTSTMASNGRDAFFWCHRCTRLHRTRGGEAAEACPICATPRSASSFEEIIDVLDSRTFLHGCHPAATAPPPSAAIACPEPPPLRLVTVRDDDAELACPICLDELLAAAVETPCCGHAYHQGCLVPWLQAGGTCPLCRQWPAPASGGSSSAPDDGLVLCDLQRDGEFALGRRVAGRVHMVGVVGGDGGLLRHCVVPRPFRVRRRFGVLPLFRAVRRLVKAAAREVVDPMHVSAP